MELLSYVVLLLLLMVLGLIISKSAPKAKIPGILLLVLIGIILKQVVSRRLSIFDPSDPIFMEIGTVTLVMLVFDNVSRFKVLQFDSLHQHAVRTGFIFLIMNILFLSLFSSLILGIRSIIIAVLFAVIATSVDPNEMFSTFKIHLSHFEEGLRYESHLLTPVIVFFTVVLIDLFYYQRSLSLDLVSFFLPLSQKIFLGIGFGVVIGIVFFGLMKRYYAKPISMITLFTVALLSYIIAELNGGNGILAVISLGFLFGNMRIDHKKELQKYEAVITGSLEVLVSIFFGYIIGIDLNPTVVLQSLFIFGIIVALRLLTVMLVHMDDHPGFMEKLHMALNCPKGYATAVIAFSAAMATMKIQGVEVMLYTIPEMNLVMNVLILVIVYSLALSWLLSIYSEKLYRARQ